MRKYKIRDKVLIRNDLVKGYYYGRNSFVDGMEHLMGKVVTIVGYGADYDIKEDNDEYGWTDEMIVGKVIANKVIRNET